MSKVTTEIAKDDFALTAVPVDQRRGMYSTMTVYAGYGMSVFNLILGGILGASMSFWHAFVAILIGNIILGIVGIFTSFIGMKFGLSTTVLSRATFGRKGQILTSILIALTIPGFVGMYTSTIGQMVTGLFPSIPWFIGSIFFLGCILLTAIFGFKGLAKLSWIAVPLVIVLSIYGINAVGGAEKIFAFSPENPMALVNAISMVIAGWITGAVLAGGDVGRYCRKKSDAVVGNIFGWVFMASLIEIIGAATAAAAGNGNVAEVLISMGLILPGLILYYLLMWTTADNNLYAFSLSLSNITQVINPESKLTKKFWVIVGGGLVLTVGVIVTLMGTSAWLSTLLGYVGRIVPAYGGILIADYYFLKRIRQGEEELRNSSPVINWWAMVALAAGIVAGSMTFGIPALQSLIVASIVYLVLCKIVKYNPATIQNKAA